MSKIVIPIGEDAYVFDDDGPCAMVQKIGSNEFKSHYEDGMEALRFFERCVGAAYLRSSSQEYVEVRHGLQREQT
jgi:hypothetical protein